MKTVARALALCTALWLAACTSPDPDSAGRALGQKHVEMLQDGELTAEKLSTDLNQAKERYPSAEGQAAFRRAYQQELEPVTGQLLAMLIRDGSSHAADAIRQISKEAKGTIERLSQEAAKSIQEVGKSKEDLREFGKEVGKALRELTKSVEAIGEGLEEGLEGHEPSASPD